MLQSGVERQRQEAMSENGAAARPTLQELVVDHPAWCEALGRMRTALSRPSAIVALLGPAGTGKTLLLRILLDELRDQGRNAVLLERGDAEDHPAARPGIVLVDEADRIGPAMLEAVAKPGALAESGVSGIVFAALPSFAERMGAIPGATVVPLRPLEAAEAAAFVRARAEATGAPDRLTGDANAGIVANGKGIPRLLGALLTAADFVASLHAAPHVTAEHVEEAVSLRGEMEAEALDPLPASPPAEPEEEGGSVRSPDPEERWPDERRTESAGALATVPVPARRRTGMRTLLGALLAGTALAALFAAYAMMQPPGGDLGWWVATLLPGRLGAAPAVAPSSPAPSSAIAAAELAPRQAAIAVPVLSETPDPALGPAVAGLPKGIVPHVVLSYQQGDAEAERRGFEAAHALRAAGFAASDPVPVLARIPDPGIAYFFAQDQAGATAIGHALGGAFGQGRAAILRPDEPLPRPGTIEIQLSSEQPGVRQAE